ncbi:MAG: dehydrogenase [Deltaproteobacteria bacterium]|nr:dehydrogenase [Deltaproteobacteria bacterium]
MDLIISNLRIAVERDGIDEYLSAASQALNVGVQALSFVKILSKSIDARNKRQFFYEIAVVVGVPDDFANPAGLPVYVERPRPARTLRAPVDRPIVVGFGPAGIFAALELIEYGLKPIIFERGKRIEKRSRDVLRFIKERALDPESNIQFGEGGAGSYSDGKLFSRIKNSEYIDRVLDTFIRFGAPEEIGYMSKPHLGTDVLCRIVRNMREHILERGGEIHYNSRMTDIIISDGAARGVVINRGEEFRSSSIFLALGHSSRDTFEMLHARGVVIEQKPISVGVRVEHPAEVINLIRYGEKYKAYSKIGAATYSFSCNDRKLGRGIYTFCMCPGGEVVNASSEEGMLVVNGMSYSARASAFSNSAIIVTCNTADYGSDAPLAGLEFQRTIERKAFDAAGGTWQAPAQNLTDFLDNKVSNNLNRNSFAMGVASVDMTGLFPAFVNTALKAAFNSWKEAYPLFVSHHAALIGPETRTSAPIRLKRDERYESVNVKNLIPIGEGSGYTGGITSSAADAIKAVEARMG